MFRTKNKPLFYFCHFCRERSAKEVGLPLFLYAYSMVHVVSTKKNQNTTFSMKSLMSFLHKTFVQSAPPPPGPPPPPPTPPDVGLSVSSCVYVSMYFVSPLFKAHSVSNLSMKHYLDVKISTFGFHFYNIPVHCMDLRFSPTLCPVFQAQIRKLHIMLTC